MFLEQTKSFRPQSVLVHNTSLSQPIPNESLQIYHQNSQGLKWKTNANNQFVIPRTSPHFMFHRTSLESLRSTCYSH
jgi:hypothetical protein